MKTSPNRILTTHVGSLPCPESIKTLLRARLSGQTIDEAQLAARVPEAITEVVRQQAEVGIDVISDGEMGKTSFWAMRRNGSRASSRYGGMTQRHGERHGQPLGAENRHRREWRAFREYYQEYLPRAMPPATHPRCVRAPSHIKARRCCSANSLPSRPPCRGNVEEAFVPAIAPAMVGRGQNQYYATEEEYVFAVAEALKTEYRAIVDAGFILQIDDPGLGETWDMMIPAPPLEEYRRMQARNLDALNHALVGIPEERVCYHLCWGSWQGPHVHDLGLRDIVDLLLGSRLRLTRWRQRPPATRMSGACGTT